MLINHMCVICNIIHVTKIQTNTPVIPNTAPRLTCTATLSPYCIPVINIDTKNTAGNVANIPPNSFQGSVTDTI